MYLVHIITIPLELKWKMQPRNCAGGYEMMIDFRATDVGECTFYIGETWRSSSGTKLFSKHCKELTKMMGKFQKVHPDIPTSFEV